MAENKSGFHGEIAGLPLTDVIQLKGQNRYTGGITVEYSGRRGAIYFAAGEIIHAELDELSGENAIYEIIKWPGGSFNIHPEMTSNICTIHYRTDFILLEAMRRMDEENAGTGTAKPDSPPQVTPRRTMSKVAAKLHDLPAVTYAVLMDKQGAPLQDSSIEARALTDKCIALAKTGNSLGELLGLGELKAAVAQTKNFHLLMYDSKQHYLGIAAKAEYKIDIVENDIRAALVPR